MEMPPPRIVSKPLTRSELITIASEQFGDMVKAVVDVEREIMALGGELHSDEEALLLDDGSFQGNLWGINIYPSAGEEGWIEYDSMINVRRHRETARAVLKTPDCGMPSDGSSTGW